MKNLIHRGCQPFKTFEAIWLSLDRKAGTDGSSGRVCLGADKLTEIIRMLTTRSTISGVTISSHVTVLHCREYVTEGQSLSTFSLPYSNKRGMKRARRKKSLGSIKSICMWKWFMVFNVGRETQTGFIWNKLDYFTYY